jgi:hypothetical protein
MPRTRRLSITDYVNPCSPPPDSATVARMARMTLDQQLATVRALYAVHERSDLGDDEVALIQMSHELDELLSRADWLLPVQDDPSR